MLKKRSRAPGFDKESRGEKKTGNGVEGLGLRLGVSKARVFFPMEPNTLYPNLRFDDYPPDDLISDKASGEVQELREGNNDVLNDSFVGHKKPGKYFYYDLPLSEETGPWIPVSVPPMLEGENEEWSKALGVNGGYLPDGDMGWNQLIGEDRS
ncbi:hypothetical protein CK203_083020 [Vitis vinifera]|uniref:Uncharacterized protein n=1 Tax=Vitis vinifera TaxID=29760 RepID=A0A438E551_VITVI|nr:hypothetical protein CK203_083020 [Vitis vinifera]